MSLGTHFHLFRSCVDYAVSQFIRVRAADGEVAGRSVVEHGYSNESAVSRNAVAFYPHAVVRVLNALEIY